MIENFSISDFIMFSSEVYNGTFRSFIDNNHLIILLLLLGFIGTIVYNLLFKPKSSLSGKLFITKVACTYLFLGFTFYGHYFAEITWYSNYLLGLCLFQSTVLFFFLFRGKLFAFKSTRVGKVIVLLAILAPLDSLSMGENLLWIEMGPTKLSLLVLILPLAIKPWPRWMYLSFIAPLVMLFHELSIYSTF